MSTYAKRRRDEKLAEHYYRCGDYLLGTDFPDARDRELVDRGAEIEYRVRVRRREMRRGLWR